MVAGSLEVSFRSVDKDFISCFQVPPSVFTSVTYFTLKKIVQDCVPVFKKKLQPLAAAGTIVAATTNESQLATSLPKLKQMEQSLYSQPPNFDSRVWPGFEKFNFVQRILDHNRLLIREINQNHEAHNPDALYRNVPLIRELNSNMAKVNEKTDVKLWENTFVFVSPTMLPDVVLLCTHIWTLRFAIEK